jgi:Ca-activated chloride channel family protein
MSEPPKLTIFGKLFVVLFVLGCLAGAYYFYFKQPGRTEGSTGVGSESSGAKGGAEIGLAYGTEKQRWLEWAVSEYRKTSAGRNAKINLIPMGSLEGAHAILGGDQRIHAWSPASSAYKDVFVQEWQVKYSSNPIAKEEPLALSPMVFVMWEERSQAFLQKYRTLSFATVAQALGEKGGWDAIASKPEWGLFKFGHTNPGESNSGVMTLVLAAYGYSGKSRDLGLKDVVSVPFQNWLQDLERGATTTSNSTGNLMKEMVLKGPSSYDAVFVYENVAIDFLKNAEGRWGQIRVVYPEYNAWNDNPFYVLNVPWASAEQRGIASDLLSFLLSEPIQKESLVHGFRPGNPNVAIRFPESPFVVYGKYGIQLDLQKICEPPKAEVLNNLLASWQRLQAR